MKRILITFNAVLAVVLLFAFSGNFKGSSEKELVKPKIVVVADSEADSESKKKTVPPAKLPELAEAVKKVTDTDVFNNIRSPLANVRSGRSEMTLVGTFKIGNVRGAIIRQTNSARQFNPYLAQAMMMGGGFGNQGGRPGNGRMNAGGGRFTQWSQVSSNRASNSNRQYVRIGETLSNGYMLTDITRSAVVLVRGNDRVELDLQDPSKNRATASRRPQRMSQSQQFQQAQMVMQRQMIRTMQQMQRSISTSNSGGGRRR